ncbi:hypothetical protein FRC14_007538 [Serendipita sp. 396]|nr:hypothetical protein FRC14_007538 [Serendipita sp. 396]
MFHLDLRLDKLLSSKDEEYKEVPWSRFQTQCTSLAVYSTDKTVGYFVNFLGYLPTLENLSSLSDMEYSEATSLILQRIPPNRPRLQSLVAASDWDLGRIHDANAYQHFQQVLRRLKTFQANQLRSLSSLILLLVSFEDLEDLTLNANMFEFNWTEQDLDFIRQSVDWNFQPKVLDINIRMLSVFPPSLLRGLTRLSLCRLDEQDDVSLEEPKLDLPRLTFLSLNSSRSSLFRFEAPNLKDLSLINTRWHERFNRAQSLRPTLVEINDGPDSTTAFLSDPPFPDINELHIHTTVFDDYGLPQMLSSSISGQSPLLPNLQHLLVIMHLFRRVRPERQEVFRRTILGVLSSCDRLISVRCSLT